VRGKCEFWAERKKKTPTTQKEETTNQTEPHDDYESQEADNNRGIENDEQMKKKQISNSFIDMMLGFKDL
jgi:hypothetical protein